MTTIGPGLKSGNNQMRSSGSNLSRSRHIVRIHAAAITAAIAISAGLQFSVAKADELGLLAPPATTGTCTLKTTEYSASAPEQSTTSTSFVNVGDGGSITFSQKKAGCVGGTFFANAGNVTTNDNLRLQVLLDGTTQCAPLTTGDYVFANSGLDFSSHAVGFFCGTNIGKGTHTVQIQWSVGFGGTVQMYQHMLVVNHS
ncbi:MAG TPA: hypothetical protein VHX61_00475 [Rhizomicrobium sp.]|jgi:hypothetical protein|nr:hypothetical protein [Rhizomicrobium sp.]